MKSRLFALVGILALCVAPTGSAVRGASVMATPGTWKVVGSMATARAAHTVTLLPNDRVLVAGGHTGLRYCCPVYPSLASAEIYDPQTGAWTSTGSMTIARGHHA